MIEASLKEAADAVEQELDRLIDGTDQNYGRLADAMRYSALAGGKRVRAWLVQASGQLFKIESKAWIRVGASIELIHAYSLIHDDLPAMDDAATRRGKPSNHKAFDEATAILAGDALQSLAFEALARNDWPANDKARLALLHELARSSGLHGMCGGQMLDLAAEHINLDLEAISQLQALKTGALFQFCLRSGAILGDASQSQRNALETYAGIFGLLFQITDDLLDLTGDEAKVGKDLGQDTERGKATFPGLLGIAGAQQRIQELRQQGEQTLQSFGPSAQPLIAMLDFIINRQS